MYTVSIGVCTIRRLASAAASKALSSHSKRSPGTSSRSLSWSGPYPRSPVWVSETFTPDASLKNCALIALPKRDLAGTSPAKARTPSTNACGSLRASRATAAMSAGLC